MQGLILEITLYYTFFWGEGGGDPKNASDLGFLRSMDVRIFRIDVGSCIWLRRLKYKPYSLLLGGSRH